MPNPRLPVVTGTADDIPAGFTESHLEIPEIPFAVRHETMYHCGACGGWISGRPKPKSEDTVSKTTRIGRRGRALLCLRCGAELGFMGSERK